MPVTISDVLGANGAHPGTHLNWGVLPSSYQSGIYIISTDSDPNTCSNIAKPVFSDEAIADWLSRCPDMRLLPDIGSPPTHDEVKKRLEEFWLAQECILYIGKALNLQHRLGNFYRHKLGRGSPHRGGHWIKTLINIFDLYVFTTASSNPATTERAALEYFATNAVGAKYQVVMPFANLETHIDGRRYRRDHGFLNQAK